VSIKATQARTKINTSSGSSLGVTLADGEKSYKACQDDPLASRRSFGRRNIAGLQAGSGGSSGSIFAARALPPPSRQALHVPLVSHVSILP